LIQGWKKFFKNIKSGVDPAGVLVMIIRLCLDDGTLFSASRRKALLVLATGLKGGKSRLG
jgi:hypothetical protein